MIYTVNQEERTSDGPVTIAEVVRQEIGPDGTDAKGLAVALNQSVVPRSRWDEQTLNDGDEIDLLVAVQGG
ncbi:sulfur carrier protein ThiS [Corynebacterium sp. HMSC28B08]|uniref:sulfur carrier protein ThiS n=1 Tax=Corynebacterium sp. HMSC28B08 TaxID=1581066 RepID=UPI0008A42D90|nr:sulfur carrier protein ThiS [Corynebacterium sp. HMSC28B08]OFT91666.1 thiamine biosynthesis protein ThiS [Corynebacterium sp. HMSC28B08]